MYINGKSPDTIEKVSGGFFMGKYMITDVYAREILDSRGFPTVEAVATANFEAVELRDSMVPDMDEAQDMNPVRSHGCSSYGKEIWIPYGDVSPLRRDRG